MRSPAASIARQSARSTAWLALIALALLLRAVLPAPAMPVAALPAGIDPVLAELLSGGGICHGDPDGSGTPARNESACQICPLCTGPAPVLMPATPSLPPRLALVLPGRAWLPPTTAPPAAAFSLARPRAPPALSA